MTNKQTFPVHLDVEFSDEDIELHIFGSGFASYGSWWSGFKDIPGGWYVSVIDPDTGRGEQAKTITYDHIRRTMSNILAMDYAPHANPIAAKRAIVDGIVSNSDWDFDAIAADQIMQCAFFGEVICG